MDIGSLGQTQSYYLELLTQLLNMNKLSCLANKIMRKILSNETAMKEKLHFIRSRITHLQLISNTQTKRLRKHAQHTKKTIGKLKNYESVI